MHTAHLAHDIPLGFEECRTTVVAAEDGYLGKLRD